MTLAVNKSEQSHSIQDSEIFCNPVNICSICCETHEMPNLFRTTCGHVFHKNCLQKWCDYNDTCPNCRLKNPFNKTQLTTISQNTKTNTNTNYDINRDYNYNLFTGNFINIINDN